VLDRAASFSVRQWVSLDARCRHTNQRSEHCVRGSTLGPASATSPSGCTVRASTCNLPSTTNEAGGRRSTAERHVLPMELQLGDRLAAGQSEEWEVASRPTPGLESLAATIGGAPFLFPDLATSEVQPKGPHAGVQWDPFH
jgi:hypothetical protein